MQNKHRFLGFRCEHIKDEKAMLRVTIARMKHHMDKTMVGKAAREEENRDVQHTNLKRH